MITTPDKPNFKVEDIIEHKHTGSRYRIKEFTLETAILKNTDPTARTQNRRVVFSALNGRFRIVNANVADPNVMGQINRIEAAVKFMREDITFIKNSLKTLHGDAKRSLEFMHKKANDHGDAIEKLTETLREELGVAAE